MRKPRRLRRIIKISLLVLVTVIALGISTTLIFLHTDRGREVVRSQVEAKLADTFTGGATVGKIEGSVLGTLVARDVVLNGPDGKPAITIARLDIELALLPLLSSHARIESLVADDVTIDLRRDESGDLQIARLLKPGPKSTWSVHLPDLQVTRARIAYDTGTEVMHVDDLALTAAARIPLDGPIAASLSLRGTWRERNAKLSLATTLDRDGERTLIPMLVAHAGDVSIIAGGLRIYTPQEQELAASITAPATPPAGIALGGSIAITAPRAGIAKLVPELDLPADLGLTIAATPDLARHVTGLEIAGAMGHDQLRATVDVDLANQHASGVVTSSELDLATWTRGRIAARAGGMVLFDLAVGEAGALPTGTALVYASAEYADIPRTQLTIALTASGDRVSTRVGATNPGLVATIEGELRRHRGAILLDRGTVVASTRDPAVASGGKAPVHGVFHANLSASGVLTPKPDLAVTGRIDGKRLRVQDLSVATLSLAIDAHHLPGRPLGTAKLDATGVARGAVFLRTLNVTATDRADGAIQVAVRTRPKQDPWLFEADAVVRLGDTVTVDLTRHRVRANTGTDWTGTGGRVVIGPRRIELRDLVSASPEGKLAVSGMFDRKTGDLAAKLDATAVLLTTLAKGYAGSVDAHVDVTRTRGKLAGTATIAAKAVALAPDTIPIDADATIRAGDGRLAITAKAHGDKLGDASLAIDLATPADATDAAAWKQLGRSAIREGRVVLAGVDVANVARLAGIQGEYTGRIDGDVRISEYTTGGVIRLRALMAPALRGVGEIGVDLTMSQSGPGELTPSIVARIGDFGSIEARARLGVPDRLFDPAAWRQLGRGAIRHVLVRADKIEIDPGHLDRLGITSYARGTASVVAELSEGLADAKLSLAVRTLRGSPISQPVDVDMLAVIDARGTTTTMTVKTREHRHDGKRQIPIGPEVKLLDLTGTIPLTIEEALANPRGVLAERLQLVATVPRIPAKQLLAVVGRTEITGGTIDGKIEVAGTVGAPTVTAKLVGSMLQVPPGPRGRPIKTVKQIVVAWSWDGKLGKLAIDGTQDAGELHVAASIAPDALDDATITVRAKQFDLMPLLVFAPGPAGGSAGRLDANLTVRGLDPTKTKLAGELHLTGGRLPIAPEIGTLRRAKIDIVVGERELKLALDGRLGGGSVKATGTLAITGAQPTGGTATVTLRSVSPIGVVEPAIDADAAIKLRRESERWIADIMVRQGKIVVPKSRGAQLHKVGAPTDMVFVTGERITQRPMKKQMPTRPVIVANITLAPTFVESEEIRAIIKGKLTITADGDEIGLVGTIDADRGDLDLFGHRYQVERASVRFDGGIDPLLDLRISHDFAEVTTVTEVRGRLSKPRLVMSSNPGTYSQGQLLGFLLGGEPGGDPGDARDRATAAGASFVANELGGYVKKALPIDLDVLRYEHATASTSAAITVGTWLTRNLFLAYRQRLESRPDENSGEGEVEYWLSRRVVVEGVVGNRNYNGVDLLWRKRY